MLPVLPREEPRELPTLTSSCHEVGCVTNGCDVAPVGDVGENFSPSGASPCQSQPTTYEHTLSEATAVLKR